jgi:peptidyl-prolyl cis-trans isomerase C
LFTKLRKLAREPLLHFLLIGAGIYGLYGLFATGDAENSERVVAVSSGDIKAMTNQWRRTWNRPPTEDELARIIRSHVRIKILHREALAMGLDKGDIVIEKRLAQKVEYLAQNLITPEDPSDKILAERYTANADRFKQPDLYSVAQIYFDPDKRGQKTLDDAKAALVQLEAPDKLPSSYDDYGDRLMLQSYYADISQAELAKLFGMAFGEQVVKLEPGVWHGPILSGYGAHLVLVNDIVLVPPPEFADIKEQLKEEWIAEQVTELSERFIDNLISRYEIVVAETDVPIAVPGSGVSK